MAAPELNFLRLNVLSLGSGLDDLRGMVRDFQISCKWDEYGRFHGSAGPDGETHTDETAQTLDQRGLEFTWLDTTEMKAGLAPRLPAQGANNRQRIPEATKLRPGPFLDIWIPIQKGQLNMAAKSKFPKVVYFLS